MTRVSAPVSLRQARQKDAGAISTILNTQGISRTANYRRPLSTAEERLGWLASQSAGGRPVVVAEAGDEVIGFASYATFRPEDGYDMTVEHSVYVASDREHEGVGRMLMTGLIDMARADGLHAMVGVIDAANGESRDFHRSLGFIEQGLLHEVGHKFGRWLDVCIMVLRLGDGPAPIDG